MPQLPPGKERPNLPPSIKWREKEFSEAEYRPIFPDSPFLHIADLVNPDTGKTYREENAEKTHNIPIGSLVEDIETGIRLFVVSHGRDCDQTPLYSLSHDPEDTEPPEPPYYHSKWVNGFSEDMLKVIKPPTNENP